MPRVGSSRQTTAGGSSAGSPSTIASARRCFSPPDRSRGWRRGEASGVEAGGASAAGEASSATVLVDQVVGRVLEQQRDPAGAATRPRVGSHQPGGVAQQRRLAGAVAPHQRDPLAGRRRSSETLRRIAGPVAQLVPDAVEPQRGLGASAAFERRGRSCRGSGRTQVVQRPAAAPRARSAARAALTPGRGPQADAGEQPRARASRARAPPTAPTPGTPPGVASHATRPPRSAITRSAAPEAALEPVLGEQDRGVEVLVQPPQAARSARRRRPGRAARSARRARSARAARRAPRRARRAGARRRTARRSGGRAAARCRARAPPPPPHARPPPAPSPRFSSGNASSARTVPITTCVSGSWNSVPTAAASSPGPCSRVSIPATAARPANAPPWKCGTSPLATRSSVDFPEPDAPASTTSSPGSISSVTSSSAGAAAPG